MTQGTQTGALWQPRGGERVGGRLQGEGTHVCLWLIHADVRQESNKHCKSSYASIKSEFKFLKKMDCREVAEEHSVKSEGGWGPLTRDQEEAGEASGTSSCVSRWSETQVCSAPSAEVSRVTEGGSWRSVLCCLPSGMPSSSESS